MQRQAGVMLALFMLLALSAGTGAQARALRAGDELQPLASVPARALRALLGADSTNAKGGLDWTASASRDWPQQRQVATSSGRGGGMGYAAPVQSQPSFGQQRPAYGYSSNNAPIPMSGPIYDQQSQWYGNRG
jgi:hypothetical protein